MILKWTLIDLHMARKSILKLWISKDAPTLADWYKELLRTLPPEKLTYTLRDNYEGFVNIWQLVLDMVDPSGLNFALPN